MKRFSGLALLFFAALYLYWRADVIAETFRGTKGIDYSLLLLPVILFILGLALLFYSPNKHKDS